MARAGLRKFAWLPGVLLCACSLVPAQRPEQTPAQLNVSGQIVIDGQPASYLIRHLPVSSFPGLPVELATLLNRRGCLIPQTYEAHHPENVIHASLERAGSSDWAVLCSTRGNGLAAGLLFQRPGRVAGARRRAGNRAAASARPERCSRFQLGHRSRFARSDSPGPDRPGAFTRRGWTTTPWPIRLSSAAPFIISIPIAPGPCWKCRTECLLCPNHRIVKEHPPCRKPLSSAPFAPR